MEKPMVRCGCGHSVLGKEILRTDLYERGAGEEYVYVKFRCARCKRIAQTFVPASSWDWQKLEPAPGELSSEERDRLLEEEPVEAGDLLLFHEDMALIETAADLARALHLEQLSVPFTHAVQSGAQPGEQSEEQVGERARPRRRRTRGRRERDDKRASADKREGKRDKKDKPEAGEAPHGAPQSPGAGDESTH